MEERKVEKGQMYRHFKGFIIKVIDIATHTETNEKLVIYEHEGRVWARPMEMFLSKVDNKKYPEVKQEYRFEEIK